MEGREFKRAVIGAFLAIWLLLMYADFRYDICQFYPVRIAAGASIGIPLLIVVVDKLQRK